MTTLNKAHDTGRKSVTKNVFQGTIPSSGSFMWIDGDNAAIFNHSVPYERFFTLGKEVDTRHIERGQSVAGDIYVGREYSVDDVWFYSGYEKVDARIEVGVHGSCSANAVACTATSTYVMLGNGTTYEWSVIGDAVIVGDNTLDVVTVESTDVDNTSILLKCIVSNNVDTDILHFRDTHFREITYPEIEVVDYDTTSVGSCKYDTSIPTYECVASSAVYVTANNVDTYKWTVTNGFIIVGPDDTDNIVIESDGPGTFVGKAVCSMYNVKYKEFVEVDIIHSRKDNNIPLDNLSIDEIVPGSCQYQYAGNCEAIGTYKITHDGVASSYAWNVIGGSIFSGQGTDTIEVSTVDNVDTYVTITCIVASIYGSASYNKKFTHSRSLQTSVFDRSVTYDNTNIATEFIA